MDRGCMGALLGSVAGQTQQPRASKKVKMVQGRQGWLMKETLVVQREGGSSEMWPWQVFVGF